jgi:hypothetical protein
MVSVESSESDEWTDDGHGALHPLPATEHYARRLNRTFCPIAQMPVSFNNNSINHTVCQIIQRGIRGSKY